MTKLQPQTLRPFNRAEAITVAEAAEIAGRPVRTVREWCALKDIGRRICGRWAVSRVALSMFLDDDQEALKAYIAGDRSSTAIVSYFARHSVPLPRLRAGEQTANTGFREQHLSEATGAQDG